MQILFYTWLVGEVYRGEAVMPGLYTMKGLFEEEFDPALKMTSNKSEGRITSLMDHEPAFLNLLLEVLQKLYDPEIPFVQRKDDKICSYCDFADLCQRRTID